MNRYAVVSGEYNVAFNQPTSSIVISDDCFKETYDYAKFHSFMILPKESEE